MFRTPFLLNEATFFSSDNLQTLFLTWNDPTIPTLGNSTHSQHVMSPPGTPGLASVPDGLSDNRTPPPLQVESKGKVGIFGPWVAGTIRCLLRVMEVSEIVKHGYNPHLLLPTTRTDDET